MYYTGLDPRTMKPVYVPTNPHEKAMQRALIQYRNPKNYMLVHEALVKAGREDLIGYDKHCLIRPKGGQGQWSGKKNGPSHQRPNAPKSGKPKAKGDVSRATAPKEHKKKKAGWAVAKPSNSRKKRTGRK